MPRRTDNAASANSVEPEKSEECLEFDDDEEEEVEEEEIEYEEIEEEIEEEEVEEDEDVVEEVEEVDEEEDEEEEEESDETEGVSKTKGVHQKDVTEKGKHAELLALPPHGSEVYVGGISSDVSSEDLKRLCEPVGEVVEVRMMRGKDDSRGYAFVNFRTKGLALKAVKELNNAKLKGKRIRVSSSQAKNKLFIGNVPHSWTDDDFRKVVEEVGPGVLKADLMKVSSANRNRGYGFVEYYNHACAEYARQEMSSPTFKLDSNAPTVSWADPKNNDSASTSQVKSVYVKNLPKNVTQAQLKRLFEHHGEIEKVVLPPSRGGHDNRYGFVHFKDRSMAMRALQNTERYELDGQVLDCSLAKPPAADKKDDRVPLPSSNGAPLLPSYPPLGYGIMSVPGAYGAAPASTAQPMLYAPRAPPGAAMVPMMLPDGRLVYVVQQPGGQLPLASPPPQQAGHRSGSGGRHGGSGGRYGGGGGSSGSSRPEECVSETRLYMRILPVSQSAESDGALYRQFTPVSHMDYEISGPESEVDSESTPIHATTLTPVSSAQMMIVVEVTKPSQRRAASHWATAREAVRKYRQKKKAHTAHLEEEVKRLRVINQQLVKRLQGQAALEVEVVRLRSLLVDVRSRINGALGSCPIQAQCGVDNVLGCDGMAQCFAGKPELGVRQSCAPSTVNCHISSDSGQNLVVPHALSPSDVIGSFMVSSTSKDE
uniref:RRM domain-containing protein n=1 Tax=Oryza glumipatula TaxID=40148 RepID=A0A0E0BNM9_9ORYZ